MRHLLNTCQVVELGAIMRYQPQSQSSAATERKAPPLLMDSIDLVDLESVLELDVFPADRKS